MPTTQDTDDQPSPVSLIMTPSRAALKSGSDNVIEVLVRLQAASRPASAGLQERPALNLALVIDRSGSMGGRPIEEARKAARFVVDRLSPRDRCSIVAFDDTADIVAAATTVTDKPALASAIERIARGGNTNLHEGWLRGAETLAPHADGTSIARVILLSDGRANVGLVETPDICSQVERLASAGVTTSTLGLGNHFNEALMTQMARSGGGRAYYGETADDLMAPFREELALLADLAGRRIVCMIKPAEGIEVKTLNRLGTDEMGRERMTDVAWDSESVLGLRITVPGRLLENETICELLSAVATFTDSEGIVRSIASAPLVLDVKDPLDWSAVPTDATVAVRIAEMDAALLQRRAYAAAERCDWATVDRCIAELAVLATQSEWLSAIHREIKGLADKRNRDRFMKEAMYASESMSNRLSALAENRNIAEDNDKAEYLIRKLRQGKARKPH